MTSRVLKSGTNRITQGFKSTHRGVDLGKNHLIETVIAHTAGTVAAVQTGRKNQKGATGTASYGNYVKLDHGDGYATLYAHLASVAVKVGQTVKRGDALGVMGNSGNSYGTHLHFEVRANNVRIDPTPYLTADLPVRERIDVRYRAHVGGRWLPWVTNCGEGADGYAGIYGKPITALQIRPARGVVRYRVRQQGQWLPWVTSQKSWAGVRGRPIEAIELGAFSEDGYALRSSVHTLANGTVDGVQLCIERR